MKHLWIALITLTVLLAVSLFSLHLLDASTQTVVSSLELAQQCAEEDDYTGALYYIQCAEEDWEKTESLFGVLLDHAETDEITFLFSALHVCAEQPVREEFRYRCAELIAMLEHIAEMEKPYYYNIL